MTRDDPASVDSDLVPSIENIYEQVSLNSQKLYDLASKTRVISWKQKINTTQKEVDEVLLEANAAMKQIAKLTS